MNYTQIRRGSRLFRWNDTTFQTKLVRAKKWEKTNLISQQQDSYGNTRILHSNNEAVVFYRNEKFTEIEIS